MKKIFKHFFVAIFLIGILILPYFVFANPMDGLKEVATEGGYEIEGVVNTTLSTTIGTIIKAFLGLLGIIFIILIIWAGYNWMTAGGNEEKISKAKNTLTRAIIGLIIISSAYTIYLFIFLKIALL